MKSLVQNFGHKLANLERLEVYPFRDDLSGLRNDPLPTWGPLEVEGFDDQDVMMSNLRVARLPLQLLHDLRSLLQNTTDLETSIPSTPNDSRKGFSTASRITCGPMQKR